MSSRYAVFCVAQVAVLKVLLWAIEFKPPITLNTNLVRLPSGEDLFGVVRIL